MTVPLVSSRVVESWMFLGVRFDVLTEPSAPVAVAEMNLPVGASPPAHIHRTLDDSFYLLEGRMVVRCGDEVLIAGPGRWVQFPAGVAHTFRVTDGPVRALSIHADDSFLAAVREIGRPAGPGDTTGTRGGPSPADLERMLAAHGITIVGPAMEQPEADVHLRALS